MTTDDKLNGKTILIGKESGQSRRLQISINLNGRTMIGFLGEPGSVPSCVSRCRPEAGVAHCKIFVDENGMMLLTNLKEENVTYVNGTEIISKRITKDSDVSLGKDMYHLDMHKLLDLASKLVGQTIAVTSLQQEKNEFSILPLKEVWESYENEDFAIKKRQKNLGVIKSMYMPCVILSTLLGYLTRYFGLGETASHIVSYIMYGAAIILLFYGLYKTITDKSLEESKNIRERFQSRYVCPNPECRHFMGQQPYSILRQNRSCPYCKCRFNEK